jgi:hypothetical protein
MKSAADFYVFEKWETAPTHAFGSQDADSVVPLDDKEAYWRIYRDLVDEASAAVAEHPDRDRLKIRPKAFSRNRGSRGHRPVDLYVSVCSVDAELFGFMPQIYAIASSRGLEVGFAATIPEDDYFDAASKARNRLVVPFINGKLPNPTDPMVLEIDRELGLLGGWHGNAKTRQVPGSTGYDKYASLADLLAKLKSDGDVKGGGSLCRLFSLNELDELDYRSQFDLALNLFAPLIGRCAPTAWDAIIRQNQRVVDDVPVERPFDPTDQRDGRKKVLAAVARRQGQAKFRQELLEAYDGRCAISECAVSDVLQAAHITPYLGPKTNHVTNGLMLRADIHTLFDLQLIRIDPNSLCVVVSPVLAGTEYIHYDGKLLRLPSKARHHPSKLALKEHFLEKIP